MCSMKNRCYREKKYHNSIKNIILYISPGPNLRKSKFKNNSIKTATSQILHLVHDLTACPFKFPILTFYGVRIAISASTHVTS